jgi:membrane-associated protease RseP (regulator of RpoE activity)
MRAANAILLSWMIFGPSVATGQPPAACPTGGSPLHVQVYGLWLCERPPAGETPREVEIVAVEGLAEREGLEAGDRIYLVDARPVEGAADVADRLAASEGTLVLLNFRRGPAAYLVRLPRQ